CSARARSTSAWVAVARGGAIASRGIAFLSGPEGVKPVSCSPFFHQAPKCGITLISTGGLGVTGHTVTANGKSYRGKQHVVDFHAVCENVTASGTFVPGYDSVHG